METHFFTKKLKKHRETSGKIDKSLALFLSDLVDEIQEFLDETEAVENDDQADVFEVIPAVESQVCEAHRYYFCKACVMSVKASTKSFNEHFFGLKHLKKLRALEGKMGKKLMKSCVI